MKPSSSHISPIERHQHRLPDGYSLKQVHQGFNEHVRYHVVHDKSGNLIVQNQKTPKQAVDRALLTTNHRRTDYQGDRPSALVIRLEQRAREQRMAFLAGRPPIILRIWRRICRLLTLCFTHRSP